MNISQRTEIVLDLIHKAALAGEVCPPNPVLGRAFGMGPSAGAYAVKMLQQWGVIEVIHGKQGRTRKIRIIAEGVETADVPHPDHQIRSTAGDRPVSPETDIISNLMPFRVGPKPKACQFIHNSDPKAPDYCGEPVERESYCQAHWDKCHTKREPKKRKRIDEGFVLFGRGRAA